MSGSEHLSGRAGRVAGETLVSVLMTKALGQPNLISLAVGFVDHQTLPVEPTRRAMERIWADPAAARAALQYGTTIGQPPLRAALLDRMLKADRRTAAELNVAADDIVVTAGSNQLLFLLGDVLFDPGDIVLCAAPTYYVYLGALKNLGVRAVGVESDADGAIPEAVEEALERLRAAGEVERVKAVYLISYFDNPRAVTIPAARRARLVEIVKRWSDRRRIYVIEDAAYRELRYEGENVPSLRSFDPEGDTVIHVGSFSKSYSPGIRVGWGVLPKAVARPLLAEKGNIDFGSPNFNQMLMSEVLTSGLFDEHVRMLRAQYRQKIAAILAAAEEFLGPIGGVDWVRPHGGLYLWVSLPEGVDAGLAGPVFDRAVAEGVLYVPGEYCFPDEGTPRARNTLRLSFGVVSPERLRQGVAALARAAGQVI